MRNVIGFVFAVAVVFGVPLAVSMLAPPARADVSTNALLREQNDHLKSIRKSLRAICRETAKNPGSCGQ